MNAEQAFKIVRELQVADYHTAGQDYFEARVKQLEENGWRLAIQPFRVDVLKSRTGYTLKHPRKQWRTIAYWYHPELRERVFYWNNENHTKAEAFDHAKQRPAPARFYQYRTFNVDNNKPV